MVYPHNALLLRKIREKRMNLVNATWIKLKIIILRKKRLDESPY